MKFTLQIINFYNFSFIVLFSDIDSLCTGYAAFVLGRAANKYACHVFICICNRFLSVLLILKIANCKIVKQVLFLCSCNYI